jgi:hypothetical protein
MSFRFSRYDPSWRDAAGVWPAWVWTDVSDAIGSKRLRREYDAAESLLSTAALACLETASDHPVEIRGVEVSRSAEKKLQAIGAAIDLPSLVNPLAPSDLTDVVRANLRGQMWCEFVGGHSRCAIGHDMYVHVLADTAVRSQRLQARVASSMGLFVETVDYPWDDDG